MESACIGLDVRTRSIKIRAMDDRRYTAILKSSRIPILELIKESAKEDKHLLMPRLLSESFGTALRIPHSMFIKAGPKRERFVFEVIQSWGKKICHLSRIRLKVVGRERINPAGTYLFVSNHLSPMDIAVMYAILPIHASIVANNEFLQLPVFSYWLRMSGAVFVEQGNQASEIAAFRSMIKRLKGRRSLMLFPEGYVNQENGLAEFKRGGIHSALLAHVPIVPICISGTNEVMRSGSLCIIPGKDVVVRFGDPIEVERLSSRAKKNIDATLRDQISAMQEDSCIDVL